MADWNIGEPYLENLGRNLEVLQEKVREYDEDGKKIDIKSLTEKISFILAADDLLFPTENVGSLSTQVLTETALKACVKTGEYDYHLYRDKLVTAIRERGNGLFALNRADNSIKVNLLPLGHFDAWIAAANAVRLQFEIGDSRKAKKPIKGAQASYQFWMEKIYKPAREGFPEPQETKVSILPPELERAGDFLQKVPKVSADRSAKYDKVIKARLGLFSSNEAPFWEVINFGNETRGHGGSSAPYPLFGPTNFVWLASEILTSLFRTSISIYGPKVEEALRKKRQEDFSGPSGPSVEEEVRRKISMARVGITLGDEPLGKQTISIVKAVEITYEIYSSSLGNVFARARGPGGRFIKSLLNIV